MQRTEKPFQVPDQSEASFPINYAGLHCLKFRSQGGLSFLKFWHTSTQLFQREQALLVCVQQPIRAILHASYRFHQSLFANFAGIRFLQLPNPALHFVANQTRIFQKFHHLAPDQIVKVILTHRLIGADPAFGITPALRTQAAVVVKLSSRGRGRGPVEGIATDLTNQHPLKQRRYFGMPGSKDFVLLQAFLSKGKGLGTHDGRHRDRNPLLSGAFFVGAGAGGKSAPLAQKAGDFLSLGLFRFAKARHPLVGRITQHRPDGGSFPKGVSFTRGNTLGVEPTDNRSDALSLFSIQTVDLANHGGLFLNDFIERCGGFRFLDVAVTIRRPTKHIHQATLGAVSFSSPRALGDLCPLVLCDHPLELHQKLFFMAGEFLHQQNLIGILAAEPVGGVNQNCFDRSFTSQIPQPLQRRPHQNRSAVAFVLKDPLRRDRVAMCLSVFQQRGPLASDGLLFFLPVRRNPRVNRRCPHVLELHSNMLCFSSRIESSQEPKADKPERVSGPPSDRSCKATGPAWYEPCQPCPPLFLRKASRACVTRTLKDSPVDFAICLKARTKLKGILTVKTTLRSGIGCIRPTFWASRIYRNACLLETRCRRIKAVTVFVLERSLRRRSSAPLMRWVSCVPEDLMSGHRCTTFYVTQSTIIPSPLVRDHLFKLKVCNCVGGVFSPFLANVYLYYVLDLWVMHWRKHHAQGDVIVVRYADDFVMGFKDRVEAERCLQELKERLGKFGLELHPEKTRLIEFGRYAAERRSKAGLGKPETFSFLGFTHYCGKTRKGAFTIKRQTMAKRMRAKLLEIKAQLKRQMHSTVVEMGAWLRSVVWGWLNYHAVPGNSPSLGRFRNEVGRIWFGVLRRRSQKFRRRRWQYMARLIRYWLPPARILHQYPNERLVVI